MDLLDRLLGHDAWTTQQLLARCRELNEEQLDRDFDIGHRTVRATAGHIVRNVEAWSAAMDGKTVPKNPGPEETSIAALSARLDKASADLSRVAKSVAERNAWDEKWVDPLRKSPNQRTYGGAIAHIITHSMHHRAQLLYLLRLLGLKHLPEGDVLSWENQLGAAK